MFSPAKKNINNSIAAWPINSCRRLSASDHEWGSSPAIPELPSPTVAALLSWLGVNDIGHHLLTGYRMVKAVQLPEKPQSQPINLQQQQERVALKSFIWFSNTTVFNWVNMPEYISCKDVLHDQHKVAMKLARTETLT